MYSLNFGLLLCVTLVTISWIGESDAAGSSPDSLRPYRRVLMGTPPGRTSTLNDTRLIIYGDGPNNAMSYFIGDFDKLSKDPNLDVSKPTVLYSHGWLEIPKDESITTIVKAYQKHRGYNIIVVDWSNLSLTNYVLVAAQIKALGVEVGKAIVQLLKGRISIKNLHLIGHSMGVHLSASIAKKLKKNGFNLRRLTGLDPALPGFYPPFLGEPVSPQDADFVDIIHTDGGNFGVPSNTGHVDFYPNGGTPTQPGCPAFTIPFTVESFCSHWRSWAFWAESVIGGQFTARSCKNYSKFRNNKCGDGKLAPMGHLASPELRGSFYLRTKASKPYALGKAGANSK